MNTLTLYRSTDWQTAAEIKAELDARAETLRLWKEQGQQKALFDQLDRARMETESLSWAQQDKFDKEQSEMDERMEQRATELRRSLAYSKEYDLATESRTFPSKPSIHD